MSIQDTLHISQAVSGYCAYLAGVAASQCKAGYCSSTNVVKRKVGYAGFFACFAL